MRLRRLRRIRTARLTVAGPSNAGPSRLQRRRMLLLWSAIPVLLALLLAAKLLSAAWFSGQAGSGFARGDTAAVESAAVVLGVGNFLEPHKAPFAAGDALALRGDYAGARTAFEASLADAPPADECRVRANLALSIERLGDAAQDAGQDAGPAGSDGSARLFEEALAVVGAAPAGCFGAGSTDREAGENLDAAGHRLTEKIEALRNQPPPEPGTEPGTEPGQEEPGGAAPADPIQSQLKQLEQSGKSAQQERNRGLEREGYLDGGGTAALTDRPW